MILQTQFAAGTCAATERFARRHRLGSHVFARLIWQENRFDPNALKPWGIQMAFCVTRRAARAQFRHQIRACAALSCVCAVSRND